MSSIIRVFTDLSVGKKLLVGFGVVLALTIAVVGTGFYAVNALQQRAQQMNQFAGIKAGILEARALEARFALTRAPQDAAGLRSALAGLDAKLDALSHEAGSAHLAELEEIRRAVTDYAGLFQRYDALLEEGRRVREQMDEAAQLSRDEFVFIELSMYDAVRELRLNGDRLQGSDPLTIAEATSGLTKNILDLRTFENQFIGDGSQDAVESWNGVYDEASRVASSLAQWVDPQQRESLAVAQRALEGYREAFVAFGQYREQRSASEVAMERQAQAVTRLAEQALDAAATDMQTQRQQTWLMLSLIGVLAVSVGLVAGWSITRSIVNPLNYTLGLAQRVASGDLGQAAPVTRRDELGQLQAAMQSMTAGLRDLIGRIGTCVGQISNAAEHLRGVTAQTSEGAQAQRGETEQTVTAMHQMTCTVQEVAQSAEQASQAARQADGEARTGDRVVQQAVGQIGKLAGEVEASGRAVEALNAESARIGSVLEVIRSVAEQTNLLALNAAIEAARAGEQGRGFAVVADEVRALALRTHESTQEIEGLIASLQRQTHEAVEQMESSRHLTRQTVTLAGDAGAALGRITEAVSLIEQMNQQIAAAAEEQTAVAQTINQSVTRVRDIGEQSAVASQQTADSSAELARLGVELQGLVSRFRM